MKKYLISIESEDSQRLQGFFAYPTFNKYKSDFKQFGIIGKHLSAAEYFQLGVAGKNKPMTPGELGCTLSHLDALKDFLASNEKYAMIFEDDVIERFEIDLNELAQHIETLNLDESFFLSLGGIQMKICNRVRGELLSQVLFQQKILKVDSYFLDRLAYAYAYVVDRKMADKLLSYHQPPRIYDHWGSFNISDNVNFYATFLFEHPILNAGNLEQHSHLEQDRLLLNNTQIIKKHSKFIKKIKCFLLDKWY
ncbi:glycosyltransferase family 25 protein [Acinetobacter sp. MD2(2019)]|uniref:glycosyltransferase family 25 protein n=1 Tax=Acinetobacter sp. MD2(2019) TaxID=2605273 RepID=UPI002D1F5906|nr:glycosyltransferase family 25 protein [Acinetobacter sp. MD2(2019)]MEB3754272.1 glycosyltransferase family 25 protein [Acinetobacter sp. MD2(2019)]